MRLKALYLLCIHRAFTELELHGGAGLTPPLPAEADGNRAATDITVWTAPPSNYLDIAREIRTALQATGPNQVPLFATTDTVDDVVEIASLLMRVKAWRDSDGNEGFPADLRAAIDARLGPAAADVDERQAPLFDLKASIGIPGAAGFDAQLAAARALKASIGVPGAAGFEARTAALKGLDQALRAAGLTPLAEAAKLVAAYGESPEGDAGLLITAYRILGSIPPGTL